jgi:hypothetical protein
VLDSYSVVLGDDQAFQVFTQTPADGLGQFENLMNPGLRLRNPEGQVVAAGTPLADGRNEALTFVAPAGGTYRIELTREEGTRGAYFVVVK